METCAEPWRGRLKAACQPLPTATPGSGDRQRQLTGSTDQFGRDEQTLAPVVVSQEVVQEIGDRVAAVVDLFRRNRGRSCGGQLPGLCGEARSESIDVEEQQAVGTHPQQR